MVSERDALPPTFTLPKLRLVGFALSAPGAIPVPERETDWVPLDASLLMESVALKVAAAFGVNEIFRLVLAPGAIETGNEGAVKAKYLVETEALLMLTALLPELVVVTVRLLVDPGVTPPKSRLAFARTRFPDCGPEPD
jgi:hypothetical protein